MLKVSNSPHPAGYKTGNALTTTTRKRQTRQVVAAEEAEDFIIDLDEEGNPSTAGTENNSDLDAGTAHNNEKVHLYVSSETLLITGIHALGQDTRPSTFEVSMNNNLRQAGELRQTHAQIGARRER